MITAMISTMITAMVTMMTKTMITTMISTMIKTMITTMIMMPTSGAVHLMGNFAPGWAVYVSSRINRANPKSATCALSF